MERVHTYIFDQFNECPKCVFCHLNHLSISNGFEFLCVFFLLLEFLALTQFNDLLTPIKFYSLVVFLFLSSEISTYISVCYAYSSYAR